MTDSKSQKIERKKAVADALERDGEFAVTAFGRQRPRTKIAAIGAMLLAICGPLVYLYHRVRNKSA